MLQKTCALVKDCDWVYVDKLERPPIISKDSVKPAFTEDFEVFSCAVLISILISSISILEEEKLLMVL